MNTASVPVTICRHHLPVGSWEGSLSERLPAARDVLRCTLVGGHRAGESVGTEPAESIEMLRIIGTLRANGLHHAHTAHPRRSPAMRV
jgi:hypothetical protein